MLRYFLILVFAAPWCRAEAQPMLPPERADGDRLGANAWSNAGVSDQILSDNGTAQRVRACAAAGAAARFVRLQVMK